MPENIGSYDAHSNPDGETADDAAVRWMSLAKKEQQRAIKAENERDEYRAMHSEQIETIARLQENPRTESAEDWDRRPFDAVHDVLARTDLSHLSTQGKTAALYAQGVRVIT